jgi:hypothetical protein
METTIPQGRPGRPFNPISKVKVQVYLTPETDRLMREKATADSCSISDVAESALTKHFECTAR